ncbi:MAG: prepilin peptidase [Propionibacteriaceae bacterium]
MSIIAIGTGIALTAATTALTPAVLSRLPEPVADPTADPKILYQQLISNRFLVCVLVISAIAATLAIYRGVFLLWWPLCTVAVWSVLIDARTTYLPRQLSYTSWFALAIAIVSWSFANHSTQPIIRGAIGFAIGAIYMGLAWYFLGFGFGDVRLATLLLGTAAAQSWQLIFPTIFLGSLLGAIWGLTHRLRGRHNEFAYGPSLWTGAILAMAIAGG